MQGMTIENSFLNDPICANYYFGLYSSDDIPLEIPKDKFLIFNQAKKEDRFRIHWLCLSTMRPNYLDVLSSIKIDNLIDEFPILSSLAENTGRTIYEYPKSIQNDQTSCCGSYILLFGWLISRTYTPQEILADFYNNNVTLDTLFFNDMLTVCTTKILFKLPQTIYLLLYDDAFMNRMKEGEESKGKKEKRKRKRKKERT